MPPPLRAIERVTLCITGAALGSVGALAVLTANPALLVVFAAAGVLWTPVIVPYLVASRPADHGALERWVEIDRVRVLDVPTSPSSEQRPTAVKAGAAVL